MTISEKSRFKKNQCILTAITASLAFGSVSNADSSNREYSSSKARFLSVENYGYPVDFKIKNEFMEASPGGSR